MSFIVIEGLDGSGKSTQIDLIKKYLSDQSIPFRFLHFPRTESPFFGELIARFLRGDMGQLNHVDPYLVALIYACDRADAANQINNWLDEGFLVLADRYVYSNIGYQCAKLSDAPLRKKLADWIKALEYDYYKIPKPDINLFLEVPFSFTQHKLSNQRQGNDRNYLLGKQDIHETDLAFQKTVKEIYLWQEKESPELQSLKCYNNKQEIYSPAHISEMIIEKIKPHLKRK